MPKYNKHQYSLDEMYAFYKGSTSNHVSKELFKQVLEVWGTKVNEYLLLGKDIKLHHGM